MPASVSVDFFFQIRFQIRFLSFWGVGARMNRRRFDTHTLLWHPLPSSLYQSYVLEGGVYLWFFWFPLHCRCNPVHKSRCADARRPLRQLFRAEWSAIKPFLSTNKRLVLRPGRLARHALNSLRLMPRMLDILQHIATRGANCKEVTEVTWCCEENLALCVRKPGPFRVLKRDKVVGAEKGWLRDRSEEQYW